MARIVVVGGGMAGLAAALFLSRRHHDVTLVERDGPPPSAGADDDVVAWHRRGAPQAMQSHSFLARSSAVMREECPDLLGAVIERGAQPVPASVLGLGNAGHDADFGLLARRLVYEAELRRAAERDEAIAVIQSGVRSLVVECDGALSVPLVRGVVLEQGDHLDADVVVDASGRRSRVPAMLRRVGARPIVETRQDCAFAYFTRYYRLRPAYTFPTISIPISASLPYANVLAFPADNRAFSLSVTLSVDDPCRPKMRDVDVFDSFLSRVPLTAPWLDAGEPTTDVFVLAGIENRWRRLVDGHGPIVGGLVLLGDAAMLTNPTLARGTSLAFMHAQRLAMTAEQAAHDPIGYVADFEAWTAANLGVWFESQAAADSARLARLNAGIAGRHVNTSAVRANRFLTAMIALAESDEVVARAMARLGHLLITPREIAADAALMRRVAPCLKDAPTAPPSPGPARLEFERLASTSV